jgi:hypothetical protein
LIGRNRIVAQHAHQENGGAGADLVAVGESGFLDASAVEKSAVARVEVEEAAALVGEFDGKVQAGHLFVIGKDVIGFLGAANAQRLAGNQRYLTANARTRANFENYLHGAKADYVSAIEINKTLYTRKKLCRRAAPRLAVHLIVKNTAVVWQPGAPGQKAEREWWSPLGAARRRP